MFSDKFNARRDPSEGTINCVAVDESFIYAGGERGFIQIFDKLVNLY